MEKKNTYTLGKLKKFLSTLSKEQLKQPVHIAFEDCPVQDLDGHEIQKHDIWVEKLDPDNIGTLKEVKDNYDNYSEGYDINEVFKIVTPKGTIIFY
jgi:hypothetical protein